MQQIIEKWAIVQVVNQTLDGKDFIEGRAVVLEIIDTACNEAYCRVRFDDDSVVNRWVRREEIAA